MNYAQTLKSVMVDLSISKVAAFYKTNPNWSSADVENIRRRVGKHGIYVQRLGELISELG
jgi:hypothetical protein